MLIHAKPNVIIRLNAGIYHIVSTYGDANAKVEADVNVEAGKLTEATVSHSAARVTFKLVTRIGGEALPDTQWTVQTPARRGDQAQRGRAADAYSGAGNLHDHRQVGRARLQARLYAGGRRDGAGRGLDALKHRAALAFRNR